jgi:SNF2 family DNA or RNA helicase
LLDEGATLGTTLGGFHARFCRESKVLGRYAHWEFCEAERPKLERLIDPWVLRLSSEDHLDLPDKIETDIWVDLPAEAARGYARLEKELLLELESGETLTANNAGALYAHCRGVANGGGYERDEFGNRSTVHVHDAKAAAVADLHDELFHKPLLVFYQFHHDADRLLKIWPEAPVIRGGQRPEETDALINRWNAGELPILLAQPASMSHGLNMQNSGHDIAWVGLPDSLETYIQANARIWRQGVAGSVRVHRILARGTVDEVILGRLNKKDDNQKSLLESLREYGRNK